MPINSKVVESNVKTLVKNSDFGTDFVFELLSAYGRSGSNLTRLKNGSINVANDTEHEVAQKGVVYFKPVLQGDLYTVIDELKSDQTVVRYSTRFVIVTDYKQLLAIDTKTSETLDIDIREIDKYYTFFLPWAGMEKTLYIGENHADIKAAYKMSKLFDEIVNTNHKTRDTEFYHGLNVFFCRLLFCFFSEDTKIFHKGQFTNGIASFTQKDGSDVGDYLDDLFFALDAEDKEGYPSHIAEFPYVNGGLFHEVYKAPSFNSKSRSLLLECGQLNWSNINPDIFGSMIQAVVNPGQRAGLGMHYTSVPNIMKTIEPLFLDELKDELNKNYDNQQNLQKLLTRISKIKVFDPACGSGNFLVIAYKELRKLEHAILERIDELSAQPTNRRMLSNVSIEHFYGIEIDDFAHEVAMLSLWLAKHQMNLEFKQKFGAEIPLIPLREAGNITRGNACRLNWNQVCPNKPNLNKTALLKKSLDHELSSDDMDWDEIYLIGNPPYQGYSLQDQQQKKDMIGVFENTGSKKSLDYISCWFKKGAEYIQGTKAQLAFVSTNSVCQGEHVGLLWPDILKSLEIGYAYTSFKWGNNAKGSAGVTCIIVNLRNPIDTQKYLYHGDLKQEVKNINAYLIDGPDIYIQKRSKPISSLSETLRGSGPVDGGNLLLNNHERQDLLEKFPNSEKFIKKYIGAEEFINNKDRWCIWIDEADLAEAMAIPIINSRVKDVRTFRLQSKKKATKLAAASPFRFGEPRYKKSETIIVPRVFSERREYITAGYLDKNTVVSDSAQQILDAEPFVFAIISSRLHMVWTKAVCGQLENRIRYSSALSYNNFPVPSLNEQQKLKLNQLAFTILDTRERYSDLTLAEMYDPEKMPEELLDVHRDLDEYYEGLYRKRLFANDEDRLSFLLNEYELLNIENQKEGKLL